MITARVRTAKLMVVACMAAACLFLPGSSSAGPPANPIRITVYAGQSIFPGAQFALYMGRVGERSYMEAILSVDALPLGCPVCLLPGRSPVDIYIGALLPDGRLVSWVGTPQAPVVVTGDAPLPFIRNVDLLEKSETSVRVEFTATEPAGWHLLYGIVVTTGGAPFDPASWISTHFYPLLMVPALSH
jgi:hypothetical protein